jgi:predicted Zn-ribbon and HTH transcriptional regulator
MDLKEKPLKLDNVICEECGHSFGNHYLISPHKCSECDCKGLPKQSLVSIIELLNRSIKDK